MTVKNGAPGVGVCEWVGAGGGSGLAGHSKPLPRHPVRQLFEFDDTNTSEAAAEPPGKPYPPYSLAEFSWDNITDSLDPATLSATLRGHPIRDPTGAFANGSLAFRVRCGDSEEPGKLVCEGGEGPQTQAPASRASPTPGAGLSWFRPAGPGPAPPAFGGHLPARGGPGRGHSPGKPLLVWAGASHPGRGPRLPVRARAALHR